jgi:methyl-accepting chemotaxis protein
LILVWNLLGWLLLVAALLGFRERHRRLQGEIQEACRRLGEQSKEMAPFLPFERKLFPELELAVRRIGVEREQRREGLEQLRPDLQGSFEALERDTSGMNRAGSSLKGNVHSLLRELEGLVQTGASLRGQLSICGDRLPILSQRILMRQQELADVRETLETLGASQVGLERLTEEVGEAAAQIDLLAINACIEATRLGERSGGIGVVAREVRRLAEATKVRHRVLEALLQEVGDRIKQGVEGLAGTLDGLLEIGLETEQVEEVILGAHHAAGLQEGMATRLGAMIDELVFEVHQEGATMERFQVELGQLKKRLSTLVSSLDEGG